MFHNTYLNATAAQVATCDHIHKKISDPVRSPVIKLVRGRLVVGSVTTSESRLLHVFFCLFFFSSAFDGYILDIRRCRLCGIMGGGAKCILCMMI